MACNLSVSASWACQTGRWTLLCKSAARQGFEKLLPAAWGMPVPWDSPCWGAAPPRHIQNRFHSCSLSSSCSRNWTCHEADAEVRLAKCAGSRGEMPSSQTVHRCLYDVFWTQIWTFLDSNCNSQGLKFAPNRRREPASSRGSISFPDNWCSNLQAISNLSCAWFYWQISTSKETRRFLLDGLL